MFENGRIARRGEKSDLDSFRSFQKTRVKHERGVCMDVVWADVPGYEGLYQVSSSGAVRSMNYGNTGAVKELSLKRGTRGYYHVLLYKNGAREDITVHRLVALAFIPNPLNLPCINHKDENRTNNRVDNLERCTVKYNTRYSLIRRGIVVKDKKPRTRKNTSRVNFRVIQLTLAGEIVRVWPNSCAVKHTNGWSDWSISECCRGKRKTAYGYIWRYAS